MAGIGGSWGSREELLHPRDSHGRFRKTFKMAENAVNAITNFLDKFQPRTFQSDGQAAQYAFNRAKPSRFGGGQGYPRLHADLDETNEHLRSGDMDESTKKFVQMMDASAINTTEPLILSRTMNADAFGLTPETLGSEQGGLEDLTGWVIKDPGYSATVIGTPMGHGPGKVTMVIATPKGTKAIIPARSPNDRAVFLDRDQEFAVSKVQSDGRGGFYVMAVAVPKTGKSDHEPLSPGPRGAGLTPQQREQRVLELQQGQTKRQGSKSDLQLQQEAIQQGTQQVKAEQPAQLPPAQGAPNTGGPPPRNEPIAHPALGGPDVHGKGTAEIAQAKAPEAPATPEVPALPPEAPPAHTPDIRSAVREGKIPSPTDGNRRREWNNAFLGVASGKKNPEDMLRELEADIKKNRGIQEEDKTTGRKDPHLADDIKAQDQLADAIAKEFGLERQGKPAPAPVKEAVPEKVTNLEARRAAKATPGAPSTSKAAVPSKPAVKRITSRNLTAEQRRDYADLSPSEQNSYRAFRNNGQSHADALQSARDKVAAREVKKAEQANKALAKEAPPSVPTSTKAIQRDFPKNVEVGDSIVGFDKVERKIARIERTPTKRFEFFDEDGKRIDNVNFNGKVNFRKGEGAAPPVAKKAAPAAPEPGAAPDIDKMTKAELLTHAEAQGVSARQSWTKDKIKEAIRGGGAPSAPAKSAAPAAPTASEPTNEDLIKNLFNGKKPTIANLRQFMEDRRIGEDQDTKKMSRRELIETVLSEAGTRRGRGSEFNRPTPSPEPTLIADLAKEVGIPGDGGGVIPARQLDLKQGMSELEVADRIFRDADQLEASPMPAPGSDKNITQAMQDRRDKSVADLRKLGARLRAHGSPPTEPNAPAAQKAIQAPDRREAFAEDWINTPALAKITEHTAAGRTINEVRDDVLKGKITPDEGIRRLENDIDLNKQDLADVELELRGDHDLADRLRLQADREKLRKAIGDQELASSFMRKHFRQAPAVTPEEIKVQLNPEAKKIIDSAGPNDIREAAKVGGIGELKGETKDELLQDLVKKIAGKELAERAVKKAAPKKLAPTPLVTKKSSDPDYVDARAIAEGLGMDESDSKMLGHIQDMLDGTGGEKVHTPAAVGRRLHELNNGAGSPSWERVVHSQITLEKLRDQVAGREPSLAGLEQDKKDLKEAEAKDARLKAQSERWNTLAERLLKTRRRPARKATEPAPEKPKLTTEEKKVTAQAAEVLGVPKEQLQSRALAKKVAAAPPPEAAKSVVEQLSKMDSIEEGHAFLGKRTKAELREIAKASNAPVEGKDTRETLIERIVGLNIGSRLRFEEFRQARAGSTFRGDTTDAPTAPSRLEEMTPAQLADLESQLGIKRISLDRGDRIAAIKAAQAEKSIQASIPRSLPSSGKNWNWAALEEDGGVMHGDSASMGLAQKLQRAGREDAARYVADMRFRISNPHGEHDAADVEKMVADLKKMRDAEPDPNLKKAYDRALDNIDAPQSPAPKLPSSTPDSLKKMMKELNQIPVARRTGHFAGTSKDVSAVDRLAQLIGKVDAGEGGSIGTVESEIHRILRSFHESVDGAHQMWRLESLIDSPDIKAWIRSFY
jgi:hypothetical protein